MIAAAFIVAQVTPAFTHEGRPPEPHDLWGAWSLEPILIFALALSAWLYGRGVRRMAVANQAAPRAIAFFVGWLALVVALVSPLDALGGALFSAHMTQHEILMLVAAPLLVLGRPLAPFLLALPLPWRRAVSKAGKSELAQRTWRWLISPAVAWLIHAAVLWVWHAPALFQATLENEAVHAAQHLSFLFSALLFCQALIYGRDGQMGFGAAVVYVFTTAVHTSVLGALLTFSQTLWYPVYQETTAAWGLTPLEDQQLGGLIMWVPAGALYLVAGLGLLLLWLRESERRVSRKERREGVIVGG